jgi:hypothetical protein
MKLLSILLLALFSCTKESISISKHLVLEVEQEINIPEARKPLSNRRPPKDTTIVYNPSYSSNRVLYIETKGCLVSGTAWNSNGDFYATASSLPEESIRVIIDSLKRAYSAFKVIVTRDERIYNHTPSAYRQKEIWTDNYQWYGMVGGVAYRNSFGTEQPCFVFTSLLGARNTVLASVHELGHTLGLPHDSDGVNTYSTGSNWMGAGYSYPYHLFSTVSYDPTGRLWNQIETIINTLNK